MSHKNNVIGDYEKYILSGFPIFHFIQLQTSFDTVSTYVLFGLMIGYVIYLEGLNKDRGYVGLNASRLVSIIVFILVIFGSYHLVIREYSRQKSLYNIFNTTESEKHIDLINKSFDGKVDMESLRISSASLIKGTLETLPTLKSQEEVNSLMKSALEQLNVYEKYYVIYLENNPNDYRVRMNYANLLFMKTIFGDPNLDKAKELIDGSYELSLNNPLTYVMDSLYFMYKGDFDNADLYINKGLALNDEIELTNSVKDHIDEQRINFPNIKVLKLHNL